MNLKILESSLNLRVEKGKSNIDYTLKKEVAIEQLQYPNIDLYCNVEYMECQDEEYLYVFSKKYNSITALFGDSHRGILCYVDKKIKMRMIKNFDNPHFLHFKIWKDDVPADIIVFRILVRNSSKEDFHDRAIQWNKVMNYIDNDIEDTSKLIIMGDWNHAKIRSQYIKDVHNQFELNYQKIIEELKKRKMTIGPDIAPGHTQHSYKGYLAIDHIALGTSCYFHEDPYYSSNYNKNAPIGIPDHAYLFASINVE